MVKEHYVALKKSRNKTYQGVDLSLEIGQASHDVAVLASLVKFFNGGFVSPKCDITDEVQAIRAKSIYKLRDVNTVIKFFNEYSLLTNKQLDFDSFKAIWNIKSTGEHNRARKDFRTEKRYEQRAKYKTKHKNKLTHKTTENNNSFA